MRMRRTQAPLSRRIAPSAGTRSLASALLSSEALMKVRQFSICARTAGTLIRSIIKGKNRDRDRIG